MMADKGKGVKRKIGIVGVGKVGTAIGVLLKEHGYEIAFISSTNKDKLEKASVEMGGVKTIDNPVDGNDRSVVESFHGADIIFITTPDRAIGDAAKEMAEGGCLRPGQIVLHMSGSLTSDVLAAARTSGALLASMHPLQSFADFSQAAKNIPGSIFCLEGDKDAMPPLKEIIKLLDGIELIIPKEEKPLYHAGAVVASNYLVSLVWAAVQMYAAIGMREKDAINALMPLIEGTLNNIKKLGTPKALTGPIARGDCETISDHIETIRVKVPHLMEFYRVMGMLTVDAAEKNQSTTEAILKKMRGTLRN
ncbi:MAG: DUF2520 domain-containing protein [Deltaproteobacteria bacterium]|uniref:DUF2520 domain-containing protein n=1 Tax=Candidatus Zymogenus saltonus TaxID=2844893 RepID=A0A9D8KAI9_9DELT|nr:DUF2520 domain-containing protein [Candidatus Zymogenus saltonus]